MSKTDDNPAGAVPVTEGQPKPKFDEKDEAKSKAAPTGSRRIAWTFLLVIVLVVFAAGFLSALVLGRGIGGLLPWRATAEVAPAAEEVERVTALEQRLEALASRIADAEAELGELADRTPAPDVTLRERLTALRRELADQAQRIDATARAGEAASRSAAGVAALERRLEELAQAGNPEAIAADFLAQVESLELRLSDLAKATGDSSAAVRRDERLTRLERFLAARPADAMGAGVSDDRVIRLETTVASLLARLESNAGKGDPRLSRGVAVLLAAAALRDAARGQTGFAGELDALRDATAEIPAFATAPVMAAFADIENHAARGLPTVAVLAARFDERAGAVVRAASRDEQSGWVNQTLDRVSSVVTVRRVGDVAGGSVEARVARAELRVSAGDLAAAVDELGELEGRAGEAAGPWLLAARARLSIDHATRLLYQTAATLLAAVPGE